MSYNMYYLGWFNYLTVWHFSDIYCGSACIVFRESTHELVYGNKFNTPLHNLAVWGIVLNKFEVCIYQGCIWRWWIGGWCFVKYSASFFVLLSKYNLIFSRTSLSLNQWHFISHIFEHFSFMPVFTKTSVLRFSVLRSFAGFLWFNTIKAGCMLLYVFRCWRFHMF